MNQPMRSLLKCSQCGAMLPSGKTVCPKDGARGVAENPFVDEATVRRDTSAPPSSGNEHTAIAAHSPMDPTPMQPRVFKDSTEDDEDEVTASKRRWEETVSRDVMVGKQLGDFVVKRRIGAGGMGIVYEGEHPIIGRKVAIKILRPEYSEGGNARDLIAEARAASAVRHRGIIDIFGFGTIPHIGQYMVMEYLEGAPLDNVISKRAPMLESEVIALLDELLSALSAAHAKGVIHRDLKPGNIFVVSDSAGNELVKVLDFGLAKRSEMPHGTSPQTRASMIVGTPEYMAPEQATGQAVGPHTDLYSVGVIAFEMLTRRLPFEGPSAMAIAIQHVQAKPPSPSTYVEVHPALDELVLRLLSKTAAQRPANAEAARRELKAIAKQLADGATRLEPAPTAAHLTEQEMPAVHRAPIRSSPKQQVRSEPAESITATAAPRSSRPEPESVTTPRGSDGPRVNSRSRPALAPETREGQSVAPAMNSPLSTDRIPAVRPSRAPQLAVGAVLLLALAGLGFWLLRPTGTPVPVPPPVVNVDPAAQARVDPVPPKPPVEDVKPAVPPPATPSAEQPPDPSQQKPSVAPPSSRPGGPPGTLIIASKPWADIYVDGQWKGRLPKGNNLKLPPGTYQLELVNPAFKPHKATITITSDQKTTHRVKWIPADPAAVDPATTDAPDTDAPDDEDP